MKKLVTLISLLTVSLVWGQTCNKLNHGCSNTVNLNTSGVTASNGGIYSCSPGNHVLYTSSTNAYIATDDITVDQGQAVTLHFDAKRSSSYFGTGEVWVHIGGYCSFQVLAPPFNDNGWVQIGTFSPNTLCSQFGPFTVPSDVVGGKMISFCIVPDNASSSNWVAIDDICVSQISGSAVATTMNEDFGTSSSGWYPNAGVDDIPYHTYKNASDAYTILGTGASGFPDKAAYFYTGFDFCSTVSGVGIVTKEINTSGYANGEIRIEFKSKYPCSGSASYTFDEDYTSYSPEIYVMTGADHGSNTWTQLPVNYYFADYNWRVASYDISAYKNANVQFKIERGGFCGTSMEAVDNIKVIDRDCSISLESCGTITGEAAPLQNTSYPYSVPAVTGATYYKWYVRHDGNLYDTAPYIESGQGTQNVTINFQTLPSSGVRVLCIPFDADPGSDPDACYAQIGLLNVSVSASVPLAIDNIVTTDASCFGDCDGTITVTASGGQTPYVYSNDNGVTFQSSAVFTNLCAGDYDIIVEDDNSDQVTQTVTISEPPALLISCGPGTSICAGDTVQIMAPTPTGGTPPYSYFWTPGTEISDQNAQNPMVWPSSSTNYDVTVTDANGCMAMCTVVITVNPLPVVDFASSAPTGCAPHSVSFVPIPGGGVSCLWDFGDGNTSTDCAGPTNVYTSAGTFDVTYSETDGNGCTGTLTYTNMITVNTSPTVDAGADTSVCDGEMITLTAFNPDAATISWDNGVTDGVAFTPTMDTIYVVTADLSGCISTDSISVNVNPIPAIDLGPDTTSCDAFITLDAGAGMDAYLWSNTQTTQTIDATSSGTYWATVTLNGCEATDSVDVTLLDCTGILELGGHEIKIYPNPTRDQITINGLPIGASIAVLNMAGEVVLTEMHPSNKATMDLSKLQNGTYIIQLSSAEGTESVQIVKQ